MPRALPGQMLSQCTKQQLQWRGCRTICCCRDSRRCVPGTGHSSAAEDSDSCSDKCCERFCCIVQLISLILLQSERTATSSVPCCWRYYTITSRRNKPNCYYHGLVATHAVLPCTAQHAWSIGCRNSPLNIIYAHVTTDWCFKWLATHCQPLSLSE
ncbi:hypothetical protein COO60DRAFT_858254 [Scenedesmus sp. NREL 46B-D3]|nr:hypothetical protein COO60DRAFT_858254 [Scenedesmus sp. NREL 46B-D3]